MEHLRDVDWELLGRYAGADCTEEEGAEVERRLDASAEYRLALAAVRRATVKAGGVSSPGYPASQLSTLHGMIARTAKPARRAWAGLLKIAAAVALLIGGPLIGYHLVQQRPGAPDAASAPVRTITTARGQRMSLRLSDGTEVTLAPASTLRVSASYGQPDRAVELEGEAVFTVTHDERRPFTVRAGDLLARDLGTAFVVRAYLGEANPRVVVREGRVAIGDAVITPGYTGYLSHGGAPIIEPADTVAAFAWIQGRLVFDQTPLDQAIRQIERWHDVDIRLALPSLAARSFTAVFDADESHIDVLRTIAKVLQLEVTSTRPRTYTLRRARTLTR